jgi:hypothetical protein
VSGWLLIFLNVAPPNPRTHQRSPCSCLLHCFTPQLLLPHPRLQVYMLRHGNSMLRLWLEICRSSSIVTLPIVHQSAIVADPPPRSLWVHISDPATRGSRERAFAYSFSITPRVENSAYGVSSLSTPVSCLLRGGMGRNGEILSPIVSNCAFPSRPRTSQDDSTSCQISHGRIPFIPSPVLVTKGSEISALRT